MREPRYSILVDIQDATERAKQGKLALYWQRTIQREYRCKKVTPAEHQAYEQLQSILSEVPQSASPVFPACAFLMEKQGVKEPELPRTCGCQNFAAAAVLPTAFSTGVN